MSEFEVVGQASVPCGPSTLQVAIVSATRLALVQYRPSKAGRETISRRLSFRKREVGRLPTREQAEWWAKELNEWAERNPRGYIQYLVRSAEEPSKD